MGRRISARLALAVVTAMSLGGCISTTEAEPGPSESPSSSPESGDLPEFDDSAEGTPGAWGRLTDAESGASFVFPEAVAPQGPKGFVGADGSDFVTWWYEVAEDDYVVRVELVAPQQRGPMVLPPRSVVRLATRSIRDAGGRDLRISTGPTVRNGTVLESPSTVVWSLDGVQQFTRLGVVNSRGMAVFVLVTLSGEDRPYARQSSASVYDLVTDGIEVPTRGPDGLAPEESA